MSTDPEAQAEYAAPRETPVPGTPPRVNDAHDGRKPKRWVALLLTLLVPPGVGHFYLGQRRRAFSWFALVFVVVFLLAAVSNLFAHYPTAVILLLVVMVVLIPVAIIADIVLIPAERLRLVPLRTLIGVALLAVALSAVLKAIPRSMIVEAFKIPSGGMFPSLEVSDHIMVDRWRYGPLVPFVHKRLFANLPPRRGELIVFEYPDPNPANERQDFVKRVIAIPGDTLEVKNGHPIINGWPVPSCSVGKYTFPFEREPRSGEMFVEFLDQSSYLVWIEDNSFGSPYSRPYHVGPGETWVLGDNRNNSADSRSWNNGRGAGVPNDNVKGSALFIWLSFDSNQKVTWSRSGIPLFDAAPRAPSTAPPDVASAIERCLAKRPAVTSPPARSRPSSIDLK